MECKHRKTNRHSHVVAFLSDSCQDAIREVWEGYSNVQKLYMHAVHVSDTSKTIQT